MFIINIMFTLCLVLKFIILQGFWFLAVLKGMEYPWSIISLGVVLVFLDLKIFRPKKSASHYLFILSFFILYGFIQDYIVYELNLVIYPVDNYPIWLLGLWVVLLPYYENGFNHFAKRNLWLQALVGGVAGTFAYYSGTRLAGLIVIDDLYYLVVFISWLFFFPLSIKIYYEGLMWNKLLDLSIVKSFDLSGYKRHAKAFKDDLSFENLNSVLITGGTSGIGLATAQELAEKKVKVLVTGRNESTGKSVETEFINFLQLDMGNFHLIREFVKKLPTIDGLVLNAGGMSERFDVGEFGIETQARVQLFGHYFLLKEIFQQKKIKDDSRVIWVTSGGMYLSSLNLDLFFSDKQVDKVGLYANIKRAQVTLLENMQKEFSKLQIVAMHPGWVATKALSDSMPGFFEKMKESLRTPKQGADTIIWLFSKNTLVDKGALYFDRKQVIKYLFGFLYRPSKAETEKLFMELNQAYKKFIP